MEFWITINKDAKYLQDLSKIISLGLTTNVVGPFLSPNNNLDLIDFSKRYPNVKVWDTSIREASSFNNLEVLAAKHSLNNNIGFFIYMTFVDFNFIHTAIQIVGNNNIIVDTQTVDLKYFDYYNILNLEPFALILKNFNQEVNHRNKSKISDRNYYMKKTRIGMNISELDDENDHFGNYTKSNVLEDLQPDFVLTNIESYKNMI